VVGKSVSEIATQPDFPSSCVFAALFDEAGMQAPRGASVVSAEQEVLLVSRRAEMPRVVEFFMKRR
jgi:trk system potassium uptake protein TrkA